MVTAAFNEFVINVKVERDIQVPAEHVELQLPAENCCAYADDILVQGPEHAPKAFKRKKPVLVLETALQVWGVFKRRWDKT